MTEGGKCDLEGGFHLEWYLLTLFENEIRVSWYICMYVCMRMNWTAEFVRVCKNLGKSCTNSVGLHIRILWKLPSCVCRRLSLRGCKAGRCESLIVVLVYVVMTVLCYVGQKVVRSRSIRSWMMMRRVGRGGFHMLFGGYMYIPCKIYMLNIQLVRWMVKLDGVV